MLKRKILADATSSLLSFGGEEDDDQMSFSSSSSSSGSDISDDSDMESNADESEIRKEDKKSREPMEKTLVLSSRGIVSRYVYYCF